MDTKEFNALYKKLGSIGKVSEKTGYSESKVRKMLITTGAYSSPQIEKVQELALNGLKTKEIAKRLSISRATVNLCLPYVRAPLANLNQSDKFNNKIGAELSEGNKLAKQRLDAGLTQTQVAAELHCSQKDISRWENNIHKPSIKTLMKLAKLYGVSVNDLI